MAFIQSDWAKGAVIAGALLSTGGMAMGMPEGAVRMSNLKLDSIAGYDVLDSAGIAVGVVKVLERDKQGHARWLRIKLDVGGEARVASFRADLDVRRKRVSLRLSEDLLIARAEAAAMALSLPSI